MTTLAANRESSPPEIKATALRDAPITNINDQSLQRGIVAHAMRPATPGPEPGLRPAQARNDRGAARRVPINRGDGRDRRYRRSHTALWRPQRRPVEPIKTDMRQKVNINARVLFRASPVTGDGAAAACDNRFHARRAYRVSGRPARELHDRPATGYTARLH